jgi:hypothetical protein
VADQIAGDEVSPIQIGARLAPHTRIFLVGAPLTEALRRDRSIGDRAKETALQHGYVPMWTRRFGVVSVTLFEVTNRTGPPGAGG